MWILIIATILTLILIHALRQSRYYKLGRLLPQAKGVPIIGHALEFLVGKNEIMDKMLEMANIPTNKEILTKEGIIGVWLGPLLGVVLESLSDIEQILTSSHLTEKSYHYTFFEPWLGKGLLISSGAHWSSHRKIITPAFHISVLQKFIPVFNSNIEIFLKKLETKAGKGSINIEHYTTLLTLDIIAETAMSAKINAQSEESEFAQKVEELLDTILLRMARILYYPNFIYNHTNLGRKEKIIREYINNFINKLVNQKKKESENVNQIQEKVDDIGSKKRVALMDLLIDTQRSSPFFTDQDILDEVNTFMLGICINRVYRLQCGVCGASYVGRTQRKLKIRCKEHFKRKDSKFYEHVMEEKHDQGPHTVALLHQESRIKKLSKLEEIEIYLDSFNNAPEDDPDWLKLVELIKGYCGKTVVLGHDSVTSGINFTLYLISKHPLIQDELVKEIHDVVGNGSFTFSNLQELKLLERVIKESLRLYPSLPFVARSLKYETKLKSGYVLPAGCTLFFFIYKLHRNPELFPEPEKFDPDRFFPENCARRHPCAYLPFSAGPRNCIGQRFAMFEMKATIAATVRKFRLLTSGPEVKPAGNLALRSANGIHLTLEDRQNHA